MRIQRTYYEVLGLPRTASVQQIKDKYHELARQFHPDRATDKLVAERLFVQINIAYRTLTDSNKRAAYDASLFQTVSTATPRPPEPPASSAGVRAQPQPSVPSGGAAQQFLNVGDLVNRANAAYMGGDLITALKFCQEALRVDPESSSAHSLAGNIYRDQRKYQESLAEYQAAARCGDRSMLLQENIKRIQSLITQQATAPKQPAQPQRPAAPPEQKKGLFDSLLGRKP